MSIHERVKLLLGRKAVRGALVLFFIVLVFSIINFRGSSETTLTDAQKNSAAVVKVTTSRTYTSNQSLSLIGNVRAFSEAKITTENAGRVVSVSANLGDTVRAGQILATLENASERASVLQAEGAYEAAVASAAQTDIGVDEANTDLLNAQSGAVSAIQSAYNTTNGIVLNSIDDFFANPNTRVPGLRIDGRGLTASLNAERVEYQTILPVWQNKANTISESSDLETELAYAKSIVRRTTAFIDSFINVFNQQSNNSRYTDEDLQVFTTEFTVLRATLIGTQATIDNSLTSLRSAKESLSRATIAGTGGITSSADAQVKQALGSLRAAQANLEKTILRTPISGTINSLSLRTGDFVGSFQEVAIVANNGALEIITFISDNERELLTVGDSVTIENQYEGIVTEIAPAIDSTTRKTEVRIATEGSDISNGDTVRITKKVEQTENTQVSVPLSAVKFEIEDGSIFTVENGILIQNAVKLGIIRGSSVEITEGLGADDTFVVDARGLRVGSEVVISQ